MFQFTHQVILNSNLDSSGVAKWAGVAAAAGKPASFNVKRVNNYIADFVKAIYKREASLPVLATASLKLALNPGIHRLAVYIRLSGSQNSYYSHDLVYKGKPLYFEFEVKAGESMTDVATKVAKQVKQFQLRFDQKYLDVKANAETLEITGINEYQVLYAVAIERFDKIDPTCSCDTCACDFFPVIVAQKKDATGAYPDADNKITLPVEGFGTYTHITKDLRIPTMSANNYTAINMEERPILGELYDQYTLYYVKERGIMGSDAVGDVVTSSTAHVFYVRQGATATDFETELNKLGITIESVTNVMPPAGRMAQGSVGYSGDEGAQGEPGKPASKPAENKDLEKGK